MAWRVSTKFLLRSLDPSLGVFRAFLAGLSENFGYITPIYLIFSDFRFLVQGRALKTDGAADIPYCGRSK
jgi:hypothetical protein